MLHDVTAFHLAGLHVLVVEDEPIILMDMEGQLEDLGFGKVTGASSESIALGVLGAEKVDLAVLDVHLGAGDSFQVATWLQDRGVPFVFATGSDGDAVPQQFSCARLLPKPFRVAALEKAVFAELAISVPATSISS